MTSPKTRALHQPLHLALGFLDAASFFLENFDELVADDLAFLLRIADACKFAEEALCSIDGLEVEAQLVAQGNLYFFEFVLAQHTVIDEHAGQV